MIPIFDRIYYTFYRMVLRLANVYSMTTDMPRTRAVLIMSVFNCISFVALLAIISATIGRPVFINSTMQTVIASGVVVTLNFFLIFYRSRYIKIESALSETWGKEKTKNLLITVAYMSATGILVCFAVRYVMSNTFIKT